ncbi:MAG TPA: Rieske 2Fe-2S domain-containing protein [Armatimonadota bacterium]
MEEGFRDVAALSDVPEGGARRVRVGSAEVALFRQNGRVFAMEDYCPHAGVPLSEGELEPGIVRCWHHGWEFELETGACATCPSRPAVTYEVRIEGDRVWVRV